MENESKGRAMEIFDPRGEVTREKQPLAARRKSLEGARLMVLDNSKWNAGKLLRYLTARLENELGDIEYRTKESFSKLAPQTLLDEIASSSDLVLTAIGD